MQIEKRSTLVAAGEAGMRRGRRSKLAVLVLLLYMVTLWTDAIRKVAGLPASIVGIVYLITALIYVVAFPARLRGAGRGPRTLPVWLFMLSAWCLAVALMQHIPAGMALLGWSSYVFFVPLCYVGAELASDVRVTATALRVAAISGGLVGAGAIASAVLGQSAPALLQPIVPAVGIHSFGTQNIYLAPSFFATAEEASEQLLIAFFAWAALAQLPEGRLRRVPSGFLGMILMAGLGVAVRRADIYVAIAGIIAVVILGHARTTASRWRPSLRTAEGEGARLGAGVFFAVAGSGALLVILGATRLASFLVSGSAGDRISLMFTFTGSGSLIGQGTGTSTQGMTLLGAVPSTAGMLQDGTVSYALNGRTFLTAEGGLAKTWLELGIIGVVLYGAVFWAALAPAMGALRRLDGVAGALTVLAVALGVVFLKGHQSLDNPLIQPLFWLVVGGIWGRLRVTA